MDSARPVDDDAFREALAPMVAAIRDFTLAVDQVGPRHGRVQSADSPAMREVADEPRYVEPSGWTGPITDTHALGGLTLHAATDYVRTFVESFTSGSVPTYGHLVVARAALESSGVSWWLSEDGIARDDRVKRGLSEFLYSATEVGWLGLEANAGKRVDEWIARAASLNWAATDRNGKQWSLAKSRGKPLVDGVGRPSVPDRITRLLVDDEKASLGKLLWSRLSAVSHVTFWGLQAGMMLGDATPNLMPGLATVPIGTESNAVILQAFCILRALRQAATARFTLMGWEDGEWRTACDLAKKHELALFRSYTAAVPTPTDE
jgi:hypothetical protein